MMFRNGDLVSSMVTRGEVVVPNGQNSDRGIQILFIVLKTKEQKRKQREEYATPAEYSTQCRYCKICLSNI